jgi:transposase
MDISLIGLDIAKSVFHMFAVNRAGKLVRKKVLKRQEVAAYFSRLEPYVIAMEACGSAHYWARLLEAQGHDVKLIAPQYVKPYVIGNKNDYNDAAGIAETAQRPRTRFVPIKSVAQQDVQMIHRQRERQVKGRTALVNQIRGLLAEYGIIINRGVAAVRRELPHILEDGENDLCVLARETFAALYDELLELEIKIKQCDQKINALSKSLESCKRLNEVNGIGPLTATAVFAAAGNGHDFRNGRHFSAWLGLVPRQHSSGGVDTFLGISKPGNTYLRTLFIHGARAVLRYVATKKDRFSRWAQALIERRGHNRACVAVANKLARIAWVIVARNECYQPAR